MIYPLDMALEMLMSTFVDEETGEMKCTEEEMTEAIANLEMEFDNKIAALRNSYLETKVNAKRIAAEAKALREEAANVQKRADSLTKRAERIERFLAYLLKGEKFDKNGVKITYRKSEVCVIDDEFTDWAVKNAPALLKIEARKTDVKEALKSGNELPFAHIEERSNIQIK